MYNGRVEVNGISLKCFLKIGPADIVAINQVVDLGIAFEVVGVGVWARQKFTFVATQNNERKQQEELMKAFETPEEKRARRLAKKEAKEAAKREAKEAAAAAAAAADDASATDGDAQGDEDTGTDDSSSDDDWGDDDWGDDDWGDDDWGDDDW
mgnify:CR=1 FL=1